MDDRALIGAVAAVIALVSYIPYFRDILAGKTTPHAVSWLIWGVLTVIGFAGQVAGNAGPGAWATGFTALVCLLVFVAGLVNGRTSIALVDWASLAGAAIALALWGITNDPMFSVVIVTAIYAMGFVPTFRKSWFLPHEETAATYFLSGLRCLVSLFALTEFTLVTALYPAAILVMNWAFSAMLQARRSQLAPTASAEHSYAAN